MEEKILVIYIGIAGIRTEDIHNYTQKVANKIIPNSFRGEVIILPEQSVNTRIECINPKYITKPELVKQHEEIMQKLQDELQKQLDILKNDNNE